MPSVANCNVPNKSRRKSNRNKIQRRRATSGIAKNPRGMALSSVIHPTSGPLAPLSGKKARKVEQARNHARQRALEKELAERGEVSMTGMFCLLDRIVWAVVLISYRCACDDEIEDEGFCGC